MFRKTSNHKFTAVIGRDNRVRVFFDDGWDNMIDHYFSVADEAEGRARLNAMGFEEYDPNESLKAKGMVFINGAYRPAA